MKRRALLLLLWPACALVGAVSLVWMLAAIVSGSDRAWTLILAYDQVGNATTGGSIDEMLSSRAWRAARDGKRWGRVLCRVLDDGADTGDIAAQDWCWVRKGDTAEELWRRELAPMGLRLLSDVLGSLDRGQVLMTPQPAEPATWEPAYRPTKLAGG